MKREEYEERMKDQKYRDLVVTNCESGKDYVFISYRGNNWKKVLTEIVYKLQTEYGLRVYFDKEFASETNIWIEQFIKNMDSSHCKAFLCFFDKEYVTSYATLLELMHAMNPRSKLKEYIFPVSFPIDWSALDKCDWNTGLGMEDLDNPCWSEEKKAFDREFNLIKKNYSDVEAYYYDGAELRGCDCKEIMAILQPKNRRDYVNNEAYYEQFIVDPLKKNCPTVFEGVKIPEYKITIVNNDRKSDCRIKEGDCVPKQDAGIREGFEFEGWFVSGADEEWDFSNPVHKDIEIYAKWEKIEVVSGPVSNEGYQYTIFGKEYSAGSREQGKLMYDAFEALTSRYPEYAEQLTQRTSVAKAADVKNANTKDAAPAYFRGCKSFTIEGNEYLVGSSYGFDAKISEIEGMFKICGVPLSEFVLNGEPIGPDGNSGKGSSAENDLWEYSLWGISHTARKMLDMMHDVFDLIAEKYPDRIPNIADNPKITAVAGKDALDQGIACDSKLKQFKHFNSKEHIVNGIVYCVNAGYGRGNAIEQINRMLVTCEGSADGFIINKAPEKSSRSSAKNGKDGINELLEQ